MNLINIGGIRICLHILFQGRWSGLQSFLKLLLHFLKVGFVVLCVDTTKATQDTDKGDNYSFVYHIIRFIFYDYDVCVVCHVDVCG